MFLGRSPSCMQQTKEQNVRSVHFISATVSANEVQITKYIYIQITVKMPVIVNIWQDGVNTLCPKCWREVVRM
jgi:hypothetical protein